MAKDAENQVEFTWGHSEGITAVDSFMDGTIEKLATCGGGDNDLRVWKGVKDTDPAAYELTDNALTLVCDKSGKKAYVGTDFNTVEEVTLNGENLGVKAKFTAPVHHIDISQDGKWLVAGSGDMKIQIISLEDSSISPTPLDTHSAPILSVAIDPKLGFLASSGCDGNVCIWSLSENVKPVHLVNKLEAIFPSSNDITTSPTLCRMSWEPSGKVLAVPEEGHVAIYARETWAKLKTLKFSKTQQIVSVAKFSKSGEYLAAGASDGTIIVWNVVNSEILVESVKFPEQITALLFTNNESDIVAADSKGRLLLVKGLKTSSTGSESGNVNSNVVQQQLSSENDVDEDGDLLSDSEPQGTEPSEIKDKDGEDAFDDGLDELFADDDDVDDNEFSISKIKAGAGFVDDEYVGVNEAKKVIYGGELSDNNKPKSDEDDAGSASGSSRPHSRAQPYAPPQIEIPFTEPQEPFQPASTPVHLEHRFMVWNNTGIIRKYSHEDQEDNDKVAIDIEFHDAAVHHAIHMADQHDYTIATLTKEVAVFANEKQTNTGSKLFCYTFASWDSKKDWNTELPLGEEIVGLAAGDGWLAAATDMNRIRLFTTGGAQKQLIEIGGQIIAVSGHEDLLFITFHSGIGLHGNQCISYSIFRIKPSLKPFPLVSSEPLPLSPKSELCWIGFSDEGNPIFSDSEHMLKILSGRYWTSFCSLKDHLHHGNVSTHFWVVGVSELNQRIRAVKCKGMRYPPTLPRPVLMQLDAQIPFCEMETEKSRLEDSFHRALMLDSLAKKMDKKNYDVDDYKSKAESELKESLLKLFALSCKGDWDARGTEYVSMMPSAHAVHIAVKLASKLRKKGLVDRLTALGRQKMDEEELEIEADDDDFETLKMGTIVYSNVQNRSLNYSASQDLFPDASSNGFNTPAASFSNSMANGSRSAVTPIPVEENPFMKKNTDEIRRLLDPSSTTVTPTNRFRKQQNSNNDNGEGEKGVNVLDSWKKTTEKPVTDLFAKAMVGSRNSKGGNRKGASEKGTSKDQSSASNKGKKKQQTLLDLGGKRKKDDGGRLSNPTSPAIVDVEDSAETLQDLGNMEHSEEQEQPSEKQPAKQGYMLWFDENKEELEKDNPGLETRELTKIAMQMFRKLPPEEKQRYNNPRSGGVQSDEKKRKRSDIEEEDLSNGTSNIDNMNTTSEKKSKLASKLEAFKRIET